LLTTVCCAKLPANAPPPVAVASPPAPAFVCVLPVLASVPAPPVAVAAPPVAVLPPWVIDASLSWMMAMSPQVTSY